MTWGRHEIETECPHCLRTLPVCSNAYDGEQQRPAVGDRVLCFKCGGWSIFTKRRGRLRKPTDAELAEIASNGRLKQLRLAWLLTMAGAPTPPARH